MSLENGTHSFTLDATDPTRPTVTVDDIDLTAAVGGAALTVQRGQLPQLTLYANAPTVISAIGEVQVYSPAEAILAWLDSIDPTMLRGLALSESNLTDDPIELTLAALRKLAADGPG